MQQAESAWDVGPTREAVECLVARLRRQASVEISVEVARCLSWPCAYLMSLEELPTFAILKVFGHLPRRPLAPLFAREELLHWTLGGPL